MGSLNETASWDASVPYFAADAILTGGPDCPDNIPIQALTNRTAFLKKQIDDAVSGALVTMSAKKLQTARNIAMTGDGAWNVNFDGSGNVTAVMSLAATGIAAGTYPVITVDNKGRATAGRSLQSGDLPNSPALTGTPTAPTAPPGTNTTQLATAAFVQAAIAALVASSPAALDTLNELATALGNDPNFATTMTNALALKAPLSSPALTGIPTAPTAQAGTSTTQIATTEFAKTLLTAAGFGMTDVGAYMGNMDDVSYGAGFYYFNSGATNSPIPGAQGIVLHKVYGTAGFQLLQSYSNDRLLWRRRAGSAWSQWNEVANLASPAFTGIPTVPTAAAGTNTTQAASTAFVQAAIAALVAASPAALDTLNELAAALGNDPNFATTMTNALAGKAAKATTLAGYSITIATQAQAEAGVDDTAPMTPLKVAQAIAAFAPKQKQIQSIAAVVAANALTLTLNPTSLDFRANALTSGAVNTRSVGAAISLVVPSGATLGTVNGQAARLALLAIDNAGTVELAVANLAGGVNLDETSLISTVAISAAATSASAIYSTTARASVPFRVVGFIDITEAAAGTWATAPATIQGQGGQALAALMSIGYGQTLQNVAASRALGTTYYNTTGRPIFVYVAVNGSTSAATATVNGIGLPIWIPNVSSSNQGSFIVPPGGSYVVNGGSQIGAWIELR